MPDDTKLPPKPESFECRYAGMNWTRTIDCPADIPRTAKHVATVEWAWSPAHSRTDRYRLSTNRSRSHWILWTGYYDEDEFQKWIYWPYAYGPKRGAPAKTAAMYLLLTGWQGEQREFESPSDPFHYLTRSGLLSGDELAMLSEIAWPSPES